MIRNIFDLDIIQSDNYRPLDEPTVAALTESIRQVGLQEPIKLFEILDTKALYVISGHHRLEALRRIKRDPRYKHKVFQAIVMTGTKEEYESKKTAIASVMANMLRKDLDIIDRAMAYHKLKETGLSAKEIGLMVHKDRRTIEMTLNVALLPEEARDFVKQHNEIKDSSVYQIAVKAKKDPAFKPLAALHEQVMKKRQGASAAARLPRFAPEIARDLLVAEAGLSDETVTQIMDILKRSVPTKAPKA